MSCRCIVPDAYAVRIPRKGWMRWIPFTALYYCTHCQERTLRFGRLPAQVDYGRRMPPRTDPAPPPDAATPPDARRKA